MSRPRLALLIATAALAACWSLNAQAQWKWRDKDGGIHISDRAPPPEVLEKDVLQRPADRRLVAPVSTVPSASAPASAASGAASADKRLDKELEARRKQTEQEQAAKRKQEEETAATQRADNCARAKSHLQALESGQRMARYNEKGEREIIDDKSRAEDMQRTRGIIAAECR